MNKDHPKYWFMGQGFDAMLRQVMQDNTDHLIRQLAGSGWGAHDPQIDLAALGIPQREPGTDWVHPKYTTQITIVPPDDPDPRYSVFAVSVDPNWVPPPFMSGTIPGAIAPPVADPYPDLRPRVPVQYSQSPRARQRSAVFTGTAGGCLRCGRDLTGQPVVNVAPATLPPATVHVTCLEIDDQIRARNADT